MDKKSFEKLLESVKQGSAILKDEMNAGEIVTYVISGTKKKRAKV
ncbi:MAG TPA: hypothetical protein VHO43_08570 [Ignavibacteriales bacterium]|nr:hypothetical protein [Ignavibacteriales bacterium]